MTATSWVQIPLPQFGKIMPSLFFFLQNRGEKLLSPTSGKLIKEPSHGLVGLFGCLSHDARTYILFPYWTNVVPLQFSHPYDTQVLAYHLKSLYRGVCKLCRVPIMVLEQIANLSVVSSACRFKSYTLRYVNTCAETNVGNGRTETSC